MIRGRVRPSRADGAGLEAWVEIAIAGDDGMFRTLEAVIDTGFTGWLTVPSSVMLELGLTPAGRAQSTMADGLQAGVHAALAGTGRVDGGTLWGGNHHYGAAMAMGTFNVELRIGNPDLSAWETVSALVDTGATCSMAPASLLHRLGVEPHESVEFELAGGEIAEYPTGWAAFSASGRVGRARVIFGPDGEYLMGATILEDLGLVVDPVNFRLVPTRRLLKREFHTNGSEPR